MITTVWAREPLYGGNAIFLAGPTRKQGDDAPSWREEAIRLIEESGFQKPLTIYTPESRGGIRADDYNEQFTWECAARKAATVRAYWIPRDVVELPGFTTNVEFGYDVASARNVVLGAPPDCPNPERNRYLVALARSHGTPVRTTLEQTVATALHWIEWGFPL